VTEQKINPSATDGQVLTTVGGNVQWAAPTAGAVQTLATIDGDGTVGNELDLADDAVTTAKILDGEVQTDDIADANVTEQKINPSATDGQVLTTVGGNVQWATPSGAENLANDNLTQDAGEDRTYDMNGSDLVFVDNSGLATLGNVGIGNGANPPQNKLHVAGAGRFEGILNSDGNDGEPSYRFSGDTNTGMFRIAEDRLGFSTGGSEAMEIDANQNVIINEDLELEGDVIDNTGATGATGEVLTKNSGGQVIWAEPDSGPVITSSAFTGNGQSGTPLDLANDAVTTLKIQDNAVTTPKILDGAVTSAKINDATIDNIDLGDMGATNGQVLRWNATASLWEPSNTVNGTEKHVFFADTDGSGITETDRSFFWDTNARGGLGALYIGARRPITQSDAVRLQLIDSLQGGLVYPLMIQNLATGSMANGSATGILFSVEREGNFGKGALVYERSNNGARGDFHFLQRDATGFDTENPKINQDAVMTIKNDGNVGIDTRTPTSTLEINGSVAASIRSESIGPVTVGDNDHTVIISGGVTQVDLPTASTCTGRMYIIKNTTGTTQTITSYVNSDASNVSETTLPTGILKVQSDGANWQQIN
ncbi:MAG: hypothetical protein AAGF96_22910, partial [Bacteroidota bacterium]